jgi:hypothetical protein
MTDRARARMKTSQPLCGAMIARPFSSMMVSLVLLSCHYSCCTTTWRDFVARRASGNIGTFSKSQQHSPTKGVKRESGACISRAQGTLQLTRSLATAECCLRSGLTDLNPGRNFGRHCNWFCLWVCVRHFSSLFVLRPFVRAVEVRCSPAVQRRAVRPQCDARLHTVLQSRIPHSICTCLMTRRRSSIRRPPMER